MPRLREFRWDRWAATAAYRFGHDSPDIIAVDTETTGVEFYDQPFAATVTWRRPDGSLSSWYFDLEAEGRDFRITILSDMLRTAPAWVLHNAKFDLQKLKLIGAIGRGDIESVELHDTQTLYHLLDENSPKGLKKLAVSVLKWDDTIEVEVKSGPNKGQTRRVPREEHRLAAVRRKLKLKKEDGYHLLPREVLIPYALRDTEFTLRLYETLWPRLARKDEDLVALYRRSMRLKLVLLRMEADGMALDLPYLERTASEYGVKVMEAWGEVSRLTGKPDLNPGSPQQLLEVFAERGVILDSTAAEELKGVDDPLARALLDYREAQKLHKTYLVGLRNIQRNGIAHPNFNDDAAKTGRMSSSSAKE